MSSTLSPSPSSPARPWWSRSHSSKSLNNDKSSSSLPPKQGNSKKFNTLATAIGLKPKKHSIAIQDPPSPTLPLHTPDDEPPPLTFTTRPPAKSVSTVRSWDDLPEPLTPSEPSKDRSVYARSVMTMSDMDPFASRYVAMPTSGIDNARLSAFSDSSASDSHGKRGDSSSYNRMSYASSSSQSHQRGDVSTDSAPGSSRLMSAMDDKWRFSRLTVESEKIVRREPPFLQPQSPPVMGDGPPDARPRIRSSASSTTLTDKRKPGTTDAPAVPPIKTRPRGMTDIGQSTRRGPLSSPDSRSSPSAYSSSAMDPQPRVIIRQPSLNRIQPLYPPSAPPTAGLPPPPSASPRGSSRTLFPDQSRQPSPASTNSSSSLSFASSSSSSRHSQSQTQASPRGSKVEKRHTADGRVKNPQRSEPSRGRTPGDSMSSSTTLPSRADFSPTRTLKKAVSQQSLLKRSSGTPSMTSATPYPDDNKALKKQRSFHHSRIPIPPMPTSLWHSSPSSTHEEPPFVVDQRRGSANSLFGNIQSPAAVRKRLFSGNSARRSSSSQAQSGDDDGHSIFSSHGDEYVPSGGAASNGTRSDATSPSFWDESEAPMSPQQLNDYVPQQIMSPAEMLRVEQLLEQEAEAKSTTPGRNRGESFTSVSTSMSTALSISTSASHAPSDWTSQDTVSPTLGPPSSIRQFHALTRPGERSQQQASNRPMSLMTRTLNAPAPANERPSTAQPDMGSQSSPSRSFFPQPNSLGLPPPPRPRPRPSTATGAGSSAVKRQSTVMLSPLSPPPARKSTRRTGTVEQILHRRSIMKKPSFLEIDDEGAQAAGPIDDSFLDLGKNSIDTVRSEEEESEDGLGHHH